MTHVIKQDHRGIAVRVCVCGGGSTINSLLHLCSLSSSGDRSRVRKHCFEAGDVRENRAGLSAKGGAVYEHVSYQY